MDQALKPIFDHMLIFLSIEELDYSGPFLSFLKDLFQKDSILFQLPLPFGFSWVQMVQPSFSALFCIAEKELFAGSEKLFRDVTPFDSLSRLFSE